MTDVAIRAATPGEAEAIRELARVAWHEVYDDIMGPDEVDQRLDNWWRAEELRDVITNPDHLFLVAVDSGDVAGEAGEADAETGAGADPVGVIHAGPSPSGAFVIPRLYVHPDRWGEGIGTELLDHVTAQAREETDRLRVVLLTGNEVGVQFYESHGFEPAEESGLVDAGEREIIYERRLD
ncbi:MAG: GNAT family N-acetyltransferase [Haloglomus sp.]